ncbi:MAG: hypothetical protein NZM28_08020 [Fimbriimonadales bacterium]|nr:hypothetical protein [Fimbriimonadales bacterium]
MRRCWLALWALWLALTPLGWAWAYACVCTGQLSLQCCSVRASNASACCEAAQASCCSESGAPCTNCSGCQLERVKAEPPAPVSKILLDSAGWVADAPALSLLSLDEAAQATFGLPVVRNHSPPIAPRAPRAPPLC